MQKFIRETASHISTRNLLEHVAQMFDLGIPHFREEKDEYLWIVTAKLAEIETEGRGRQIREARAEACDKWLTEFARVDRDMSCIVTRRERRESFKKLADACYFYVIFSDEGIPEICVIRGDDYIVLKARVPYYDVQTIFEDVAAYFDQKVSLEHLAQKHLVFHDGYIQDEDFHENVAQFGLWSSPMTSRRSSHSYDANSSASEEVGRFPTILSGVHDTLMTNSLMEVEDESLGDNEYKAQMMAEITANALAERGFDDV